MLRWIKKVRSSLSLSEPPNYQDNELHVSVNHDGNEPRVEPADLQSSNDRSNEEILAREPEVGTAMHDLEAIKQKKAYDLVSSCIHDATVKHASMLSLKRRQLVHSDDYGNLDITEWRREMEYFFENVVVQLVSKKNSDERVLIESAEHIWTSVVDEGARTLYGYETIQCSYDHYAELINAEVDSANQSGVVPAEVPTDGISPARYESICGDLLSISGWVVNACGGVGDQGVDLLASKGGIAVAIQCKFYTKEVGNSAVQEVYTGMALYKADIAVVVSPSGYTKSAREAAAETGVILLHHLDLAKLESFL